MSMTLPTLSHPKPFLRISALSHLGIKTRAHILPVRSLQAKTRSFNAKPGPNFPWSSGTGLDFVCGRKLLVFASAGNGGTDDNETEKAARGESTMPERFRYLTKEAPDPPVRWPLFVGKFFFSLSFYLFVLERNCGKEKESPAKEKIYKKKSMLFLSSILSPSFVPAKGRVIAWILLCGPFGCQEMNERKFGCCLSCTVVSS